MTHCAIHRNAVRRAMLLLGLALLALQRTASSVEAQQRPMHYFQSVDLTPGAVGRGQLARDPRRIGHFQPVEVHAPHGATIALAAEGTFDPPEEGPVKAGMLIGEVYRFRVANIPNLPGREVYPSIEVINRLHPPEGKANRFPIPVHVTQEELELALEGQFVTRVIYLEDPTAALPDPQKPDFQPYLEVREHEDPLEVADRFGRPMAILRMGSRIPDMDENGHFQFGMPPLVRLPREESIRSAPSPSVEAAIERNRNHPRMPLQRAGDPRSQPETRVIR